MSSFLSSLASKAQSALEQSPIAGQVSQLQSKLQGGTEHPTANEAAAHGGVSSRALGNLSYQFRNLQMQYGGGFSPVQRIITTEKGVVIDFDSISNDSKGQSKELYTWGQSEAEDIKDVSDRLAYLNYVHGSLAGTLAGHLDKAREAMKELRDAERALEPKRNIRTNLRTQIARIEHDQQRGMERRLAELKQQLDRAEAEDLAAEKELEVRKRTSLASSEKAKWAALREYGEKLVLLAEASEPFISALPPVPPSASQPYQGAQSTAATRASLQTALDNYKPGSLTHSFQPTSADLSRADTRSFGLTHATELADIAAGAHTKRPDSPPVQSAQVYPSPSSPPPPVAQSYAPPPVNPAVLNNNPAPIPTSTSPANTGSIQSNILNAPTISTSLPPIVEPTVAETGVPVSAGASGPGPARGSIHDLKSTQAGPSDAVPGYGQSPAKYESAEEEKKRLQNEERARSQQVPVHYESAEDEKKRLEREEREKILRGDGSAGPSNRDDVKDPNGPSGPGYPDDSSSPPPYQD